MIDSHLENLKNYRIFSFIKHFLLADKCYRSTCQREWAEVAFAEVDQLAEQYFFKLKELSHALFRKAQQKKKGAAWHATIFDLIIGAIFHESMHLKEYLYLLQDYKPRFKGLQSDAGDFPVKTLMRISEGLEREAEKEGPQCVTKIGEMWAAALSLFPQVIRPYRKNDAVLRYLYHQRQAFEATYADLKDGGIWTVLFPNGLAEVCFRVGTSYFTTQHYQQAVQVWQDMAVVIAQQDQPPPECERYLKRAWKSCSQIVKQASKNRYEDLAEQASSLMDRLQALISRVSVYES